MSEHYDPDIQQQRDYEAMNADTRKQLSAALKRITFLLAENERLTAELKATQENEQHLSDANKPLLAENERLTAVYEAADRICNKPIYSKSDEDRLRKALAAVEQEVVTHYRDGTVDVVIAEQGESE